MDPQLALDMIKDWASDKDLLKLRLERLLEEEAEFKRSADAFCAATVAGAAASGEGQEVLALQQRMLRHLIWHVDYQDPISPVELAEAMGERNRRLLRRTGRLLVGKGLIVAETTPDNTPEGEHVLGYFLAPATASVFEAFLDASADTLESEAAKATQQ